MSDLILTGASRGIGHALALAISRRLPGRRLLLVARDAARLDALGTQLRGAGTGFVGVPGDLSSLDGARQLGSTLAALVRPGATLIHNAGLWPARLELTSDGLERAFATNHAGPLLLQQPLLASGKLARILVVGAGLMIKGRFDAGRTPSGRDFSGLRTYCDTKLGFAVAMRDVARVHPEVDVLVMHPGVVRTDLGARGGLLGWVLSRVKRSWESPETCAERLVTVLESARWSPPGDARWWVELTESPWPPVAQDPEVQRQVREAAKRWLPLSAA